MVSQKVTVVNSLGMHMRPAQLMVNAMGKFDCTVTILFGTSSINAKSIMNLMASRIRMGCEIEICCDGPQEAEALRTAVRLVESGLGDL